MAVTNPVGANLWFVTESQISRYVQFIALSPKELPIWLFNSVLRELPGSALSSHIRFAMVPSFEAMLAL